MKKYLLGMMVVAGLTACENGKVDEGKLNDAGEKLQKSVQKGTDSIGAKLKRLKNKIDTSRSDTGR